MVTVRVIMILRYLMHVWSPWGIPSPILRIKIGKQDKSGDVGISLGFNMLKLWTTLYSWDAHPSTWILILSARRRIRAVVIGSQWSPLGMLEESEESVLKTKARHFNLHPVCDSFQGIARSRALIAPVGSANVFVTSEGFCQMFFGIQPQHEAICLEWHHLYTFLIRKFLCSKLLDI